MEVGRLRDLSLNLLEVRNLLKHNQDLMKLLTDNDTNVLRKDYKISEYKIDDLAKEYIIPYSQNPDVVQETKSFLCLSYVKVARDFANAEIKLYALSVKVYCHKDLHEIDNAIRPLEIAHQIDKELNNTQITSIGRINFDLMEEIENSNGKYYGYEMYYTIGDFN